MEGRLDGVREGIMEGVIEGDMVVVVDGR